jgi:hypothetical protein
LGSIVSFADDTDMVPCRSFSLAPIPGSVDESPRANVLIDASSSGTTVPGVILEAQYRSGESYLLFTSENTPYEEALHVLLLSRRLALLDHVELSHPFAGGVLTNMEMPGDERLRFSFFGGDLWELTVLGAPRLLKRHEAPTGVKGRIRRLLAPRWLAVQRLR